MKLSILSCSLFHFSSSGYYAVQGHNYNMMFTEREIVVV